eukprot:c13162_g1_i1.p1 GENE.c13162_g1_i1~~c13162_g1_i1.p1  ORF type:complete len:466 (-),score=161.56 c13162_g1_i1:115-1512(-)
MFIVKIAIFSLLIQFSLAAVDADRVTSLPGFVGDLPSVHYSGYIPTGVETKLPGFLHYWFILSENNPSTDPIVLWTNGGPGSSSLIGLLTENGQVNVNIDSLRNTTGKFPTLFYNPYSWTQNASVLYVEHPKGVGFSFCTDGPENCNNDDTTDAIDNHEFLVNFFAVYPEFSNNDFYITGESYAGVYIPMLIDQIRTKQQILNFKGAAIGNGCWGGACFNGYNIDEINYHILSDHAFISQTLSAQIAQECNFTLETQECQKLLNKMNDQAGAFNIYNIYDECGNDQVSLSEKRKQMASGRKVTLRTLHDSFVANPNLEGALNDYKCGTGEAMDAYLAFPEVQAALHVNSTLTGMNYNSNIGDLRPLYKSIFQQYRIVIYSGDVDGCVPYWGTEQWTRGIGFSVVKDWHPWTSESPEKAGKVVAGYAIEYEHFTFITVKGSGHLVPLFKPASAKTMLDKVLANSPF